MARRPVCIEAPCAYQNPVPALEPIDDKGPHTETEYRCPWCHRRYSHEFVYRTFLRNALEGDTETQEPSSDQEPSQYTLEELKALRASERPNREFRVAMNPRRLYLLVRAIECFNRMSVPQDIEELQEIVNSVKHQAQAVNMEPQFHVIEDITAVRKK